MITCESVFCNYRYIGAQFIALFVDFYKVIVETGMSGHVDVVFSHVWYVHTALLPGEKYIAEQSFVLILVLYAASD